MKSRPGDVDNEARCGGSAGTQHTRESNLGLTGRGEQPCVTAPSGVPAVHTCPSDIPGTRQAQGLFKEAPRRRIIPSGQFTAPSLNAVTQGYLLYHNRDGLTTNYYLSLIYFSVRSIGTSV